MKKIDLRLNKNEVEFLKNSIGDRLLSISHDPFMFTNTSSQAVKISIGEKEFFLYSFSEPQDYYGSEEDVAVWSIEEKEYPLIKDKCFVDVPVNEEITGIVLVNENQRLRNNAEQLYDVWVTRGIIIELGDHQIAFEKAVWFSEDIVIHKGYELQNNFSSVEAFINSSWKEGVKAECSREMVRLT